MTAQTMDGTAVARRVREQVAAGVAARIAAGRRPPGLATVLVGRSVLVGRPMAQLLLARDATVVMCHSRTRDLADVCRRADVLVVAAGVPNMIGADAVNPGAAVVDVGIHRTPDGLCGDVRFDEVDEVAGLVSPVPGGVGPLTIAMLLANTLQAAEAMDSVDAEPASV